MMPATSKLATRCDPLLGLHVVPHSASHPHIPGIPAAVNVSPTVCPISYVHALYTLQWGFSHFAALVGHHRNPEGQSAEL